ncbi:MAG: protein translocase subunit SecF [Oscillospiraceae bacterium]
MKRRGIIWFFVVLALIVFLALSTMFGIETRYGDTVTPIVRSASDIRFGIDIRGGVDVSFVPAGGAQADESQLAAAQAVVEQRLINLGVNDYEIYKDVDKGRIILRFPWKEGVTNFNPETAIQELAATALLTFREGSTTDSEGLPSGVTKENIILEGNDVLKASPMYGQVSSSGAKEYFVQLELSEEATAKFAEATAELAQRQGTISIWMDDVMISNPTVNDAIDSSTAIITGSFTAESATELADKINAGALPFALEADSYSTISPTLGSQSLRAMIFAGVLALILVAAFMIFTYRLPGFVASLSLVGQTVATIAFISGYFVVFNSSTLTLPGIAGIILAIGMGVDANVITSERIKEELRSGKKLDVAVKSGFQMGLPTIIDSNVTVLIVAAILMGAFGPTDGFFAMVFKPIFFAFGPSTAGTIYSFGYTLLVGVLLNFVFGVFCNRVMLTSLSKFSFLRKPTYYGGLKEGQEAPARKEYNIVGSRKRWFSLSGIIIALIILATVVFGVQMDVQFKGGAIITYSYTMDFDLGEAQTIIDETLQGQTSLQTGENSATTDKTLTITMPGTSTVTVETLDELTGKLNEAFTGNKFAQLEVSNVDASIGRTFLVKCIVAVLAASILILIYIAFRFRKIGGWRGGLTAVVALVHDLIVVYGVFVIFGIPLGGNFIAALLTILGYSINDTVVIYDRVRENRRLLGKNAPFAELVNLSINQSLRRSINTTLTTLMALGCVCVFALVYRLEGIFTFAFPMMIGMVSGVYSTVCIAGPLWVMWDTRRQKKLPGKKAPKKLEEANDAPEADEAEKAVDGEEQTAVSDEKAAGATPQKQKATASPGKKGKKKKGKK